MRAASCESLYCIPELLADIALGTCSMHHASSAASGVVGHLVNSHPSEEGAAQTYSSSQSPRPIVRVVAIVMYCVAVQPHGRP